MIALIMRWWRAHQRQIDIDLLWPVCVAHTPDLEHAKGLFAVHAFSDPAWRALGHAEMVARIDALERVPTGGAEL